MSLCLQTLQLTKWFGRTCAIDHLSLEVESGEVLGLLGPNGAGKSTTLYMLCGLVPPTGGAISIFGKDLRRNFLEIVPRVGVVLERPVFYDYMTARDNLLMSARLAGRNVTVDRALDRVGLLHAARKRVKTLSSGMRQRLALAQAILLEPELLLLDEPANGLDPESSQEVLQLLRSLAEDAGVTILVSSHMLHEVQELCDRVAVINKGKMVACDSVDALLTYDQARLEILIDNPEAAAKHLVMQPWVESAEARPGRLIVALREPNAQQVTAFLVGQGFRIGGIIPKRRTLQDYFLKVFNS
jgi:ABC-2 type transport system ATP-binding protein